MRSGEKNLYRGIRQHDGADVAPGHDDRRTVGDAALRRDHLTADLRLGGDGGNDRGHFGALQVVRIEFAAAGGDAKSERGAVVERDVQVRVVGQARERGAVIDVGAAAQREKRQRAIHRAGIEIEGGQVCARQRARRSFFPTPPGHRSQSANVCSPCSVFDELDAPSVLRSAGCAFRVKAAMPRVPHAAFSRSCAFVPQAKLPHRRSKPDSWPKRSRFTFARAAASNRRAGSGAARSVKRGTRSTNSRCAYPRKPDANNAPRRPRPLTPAPLHDIGSAGVQPPAFGYAGVRRRFGRRDRCRKRHAHRRSARRRKIDAAAADRRATRAQRRGGLRLRRRVGGASETARRARVTIADRAVAVAVSRNESARGARCVWQNARRSR